MDKVQKVPWLLKIMNLKVPSQAQVLNFFVIVLNVQAYYLARCLLKKQLWFGYPKEEILKVGLEEVDFKLLSDLYFIFLNLAEINCVLLVKFSDKTKERVKTKEVQVF